MPPRPLTSRPATLGDAIDRAQTLTDLLVAMSHACTMRDRVAGHEFADEIMVKALRITKVVASDRPLLTLLAQRFEKAEKHHHPNPAG